MRDLKIFGLERVRRHFESETWIIQFPILFLNQARAWFLEIALVRASVCVSAPEAINNQWRDIDRVRLVKVTGYLLNTFTSAKLFGYFARYIRVNKSVLLMKSCVYAIRVGNL